MADVGSGAGFPGLVLAIALPSTRVSLIERHSHLAGYLRNAAADLGLDNVEVEVVPVESWTEGVDVYDLITSRKMGRPNTILGWVAPLLRPGGVAVLFYKERGSESESLAVGAAAANGLAVGEVVPVPTTERRGQGGIPQEAHPRIPQGGEPSHPPLLAATVAQPIVALRTAMKKGPLR